MFCTTPKPPIPLVGARELCLQFWAVKDWKAGTHLSISKSIEHADHPIKTGMFALTRGHATLQAVIFEKNPNGNGTKMTEVRFMSMKGSIPGAVIEKMRTSIPAR
jgi:hypothetical protein